METRQLSTPRPHVRAHRLIEQLESRLLLSAATFDLARGLDSVLPTGPAAKPQDHLFVACQTEQDSPRFDLAGDLREPLALIMNAGASAGVEQSTWLQLNDTVLGHWQGQQLAAEWTKLTGPGNVVFSDPMAANSQVRFDAAGDYLLQLQAAADGVTVFGQLQVEVDVDAANVVNIDQTWLNAQGPGPYYLTQAGKTYSLRTDVNVEGTAFIVLNRDITLELNGHAITYGNSPPIEVPNGGFENGTGPDDIPGWTFSNASNAARVAARRGFWGDWALQLRGISATTPQIATSQQIAIPLANVEYAALVTPKGSYDAKVNIAVVDSVTGQVLANANSSNIDRGFSAFVRFTPTSTNPVQIRITASTTASGNYSVDMDQVALTRSRDYGIVATTSYWDLPQHLRTSQVTANAQKVENIVIRNGTVSQGIAGGYRSDALYVQSVRTSLRIADMNLTVNGTDSQHIFAQYAPNTVIENNHLTGALQNITDRMRLYAGINLFNASGNLVIEGNTIDGTLHVPIVVTRQAGVNNNSVSVIHNTIEHNSKWTDGYGIVFDNVKSFQIRNNTIQPANGRGILLDTWGSDHRHHNGVIDGNTVEAREVANLEYSGTGLEATALRMRNWLGNTDPFRNLTITNNVFFGETGEGASWAATGARLTFRNDGSMDESGIAFEGNTFRAILNSIDPNYVGARSPRAWGMSFSSILAGVHPTFRNNRFESNDISLNFGDNDGWDDTIEDLVLQGNTFVRLDSGVTMTHRSVVAGDWSATVKNVKLIDNKYEGGASSQIHFLGSKLKDISIGWLLDIAVNDPSGVAVVGASVSVFDRDNNSVLSGVTNDNGDVTELPIVAMTYHQATSNPAQITIDSHGPFRLEVSLGSQSHTQSFELTDNLRLTVILD